MIKDTFERYKKNSVMVEGGFTVRSVVITGATSMLGMALIKECLINGTEVHAILRKDSRKLKALPISKLIKTYEYELSEYKTATIPAFHHDALYHFAWEATKGDERYHAESQVRDIGYTLDSIALAEKLGCKKFVGAGSQAEYGRVSGSISTDMKVAPDSAYGVAKYAAGRLGGFLCENQGLEFNWARIFSVYGIHDAPHTMIMYCIDALLKGERPSLTKGEQRWDYLYCEDAARALYLIGERGISGKTYNVGSGIVRPLKEYIEALRDAVNPELPLDLGKRAYDKNQVMHLCADISELRKDTGFEPTVNFEAGICETISWVKESML